MSTRCFLPKKFCIQPGTMHSYVNREISVLTESGLANTSVVFFVPALDGLLEAWYSAIGNQKAYQN